MRKPDRNRKRKKAKPFLWGVLSLFVVTGAIATVIVVVGTKGFTDVREHWAKEQIEELYIKGKIKGYEDGSFRPGQPVTREEGVAMLASLLPVAEVSPSGFSDTQSRWSDESIARLKDLNIIKGYEDATFQPTKNMTRAEFASLLYRFLVQMPIVQTAAVGTFHDINGNWAKPAIEKLSGIKLFNGYTDGTFGPDREITRAEVAVLINHVDTLLSEGSIDETSTKNFLGAMDESLRIEKESIAESKRIQESKVAEESKKAEEKRIKAYKKTVQIPVLTYHHVDAITVPNPYIVTPDVIEKMIVALQKRGYEFITGDDLIAFHYHNKPLPKKPVMITLDDGYENNYTKLYPVLKKTGAKVTISLIGKFMDAPPFMSWAQVKEMSDSGLVKFENHTYDLHDTHLENGKIVSSLAGALPGETAAEHQAKIKADLQGNAALIEQHTGKKVQVLVYPHGSHNDAIIPAVKDSGMLLAFSGGEDKSNRGDIIEPYAIKRYNIPQGLNIEAFLKKLP